MPRTSLRQLPQSATQGLVSVQVAMQLETKKNGIKGRPAKVACTPVIAALIKPQNNLSPLRLEL